jgi:hypothetical protein
MGILAAAIFVLSTIDPKRISQALGSVAVGMGEMVAAILILRGATTGGLSLPFIAGSIILLSAAMVILATAMKIFATMSWGEIAKGLVGVAGGLSAVGLATNLMNGPKLIVNRSGLDPSGYRPDHIGRSHEGIWHLVLGVDGQGSGGVAGV